MKNRDDINRLLAYFQNTIDKSIQFDEESIVSAYLKHNENQSLPIKILSVFGGILASLAFVGFLFIAGLYNSNVGMVIFGTIFIISAIWVNKLHDRIIMDTLSVSSFIIGFILLGFGLGQLRVDENITCIIFILIALGSLRIVQNYILSFISVLMINGSILVLITANKGYDLIHLYVALLAIAMTYLFLKEARIITINKTISKLYNPVRTAVIFSFLSSVLFLGKKGLLPMSPDYIWLAAVVIILLIVYLISRLFNVLNISEKRHKIAVYIFTVLVLLPTALSPAISGAILLILLSFMINYKTGLVLGIISFIYYISQYYYDLNFTLLTKSILLFSTGILFIALYLFTYKKLTAHEKV